MSSSTWIFTGRKRSGTCREFSKVYAFDAQEALPYIVSLKNNPRAFVSLKNNLRALIQRYNDGRTPGPHSEWATDALC